MTEDERRKLLDKIGHIARLYGDAEVLLTNDRYPGAALVAALAYEEVGKFVQAVWTDWGVAPEKMGNSHSHKQRAVACLLIVADLYPEASEIVARGGVDDGDLDLRVRRLQSTNNQKASWWVILGGMQKFKHLAMYWDESNDANGVYSSDIKKHHVDDILRVLDPALDHLRDPKLLRFSAKVWKIAGDILASLEASGLKPWKDVPPLNDGI